MKIDLIINNIVVDVLEGMTLNQSIKSVASKLEFEIIIDDFKKIQEGQRVLLKIDDKNIFLGFIFTITKNKDNILKIIAYDQLRYLKNNGIYNFIGKSATDIIKKISSDFGLKIKKLEDTYYKIPSLICDNNTLTDLINKALLLTVQNTNNLYILYDECGELVLNNIKNMFLNLKLDNTSAVDYEYSTSIDNNVYNLVNVIDTKTNKMYIAKDDNNIKKWGILQYIDKAQEGENISIKAQSLLKLYNRSNRSLNIKGVKGDLNIRAGCTILVDIDLTISKMLIKSVTHYFYDNEHKMDFNLIGGDLNI